jgi:KRAB domain-containing zinc finger protein
MCVNLRQKLAVVVQRLTDEQLLALANPKSDEHMKSATKVIPGDMFSTEELVTHNKMACSCCSKLFYRKSALKRHIQHHAQLRSYACDVPGCSYAGKFPNNLQKHKRAVHPSILYTCLLCGKNLKTRQNYKLHMANHNTETPGVFKCLYPKCKKLFKNGDDFRKHTKEKHEDVKRIQCEVCEKFFASKITMSKHIILHWDQRPFKCDAAGCSYSAKRSGSLLRHKNNLHTFHLLRCGHCGKMFKNKIRFKVHLRKHRLDTPAVFICLHIYCQQTFFASEDLKTHMDRHELNKCDVPGCLFMCKLKRNLHTHWGNVHSIWLHKCQLCGKGFYYPKDLKRHMQIHETGEPGVIKCGKNKCKQTFTSIVNLKEHLANHGNLICQQNASKYYVKEFECHLCGKNIKGRKTDLKIHMEKHETDTSGVIKCIYRGCKQTFPSATDLKQHALQHKDVSLRPYACDLPQCKYASRNKENLNYHKRKVHSSNLYTCALCGRQIKHFCNIARHMLKCLQNHLSAESTKSYIEGPNAAEGNQDVVCKDEIEEEVFD